MGQQNSTNHSRDIEMVLERLERQRIQREIALYEAQQQRRRAYELAYEREKLQWTGATGAILTGLLIANAYKSKKTSFIIPIPPILAYLAYKANQCYGTSHATVATMATVIWQSKKDSLTPFLISPEAVTERTHQLAAIRKETDF
ncbi:unnamed protein product, partial [Mesorhabditis spiculigera]